MTCVLARFRALRRLGERGVFSMGFRGDARRIARYNAGAMRFTQRFKRLTVWNKIGFIASVASIGSIPLSLFLFLLSQQVSVEKAAHPTPDAGVQEAQV